MTESELPRCPICRKPLRSTASERRPAQYPFCSPRCKLIDLGNWLGNSYVIADKPVPELEGLSDEELAALLREPS
jgi:endogenous inhibitor of DNA gyrase (YacG/DUF329 family)